MKTPEEVKKALACCAEASPGACGHCPYVNDCEDFGACKLPSDALSYINQLEARVPKWISVEGRKPEGVVLVANFAPGTDGYKKMDVADVFDAGNSDITFYLLNGFDVEYDVTHWMPIPTPPPKKG